MKHVKRLRYGLLFVVCFCVVTFGGLANSSLANPSIVPGSERVRSEIEAVRPRMEVAQATERPIAPTGDFVRDTLAAPVICPARLGVLIDNIIDQSTVSAGRWGIVAESPFSSEPLYSRNAEDFLIPASNIKLLTTAAALQLLDVTTPSSRSSLEYRMRIINGNSDNPSADALLAQIGGTRSVQDTLLQLGIDPGGYRQVDGSGLSRNNIAQPKTFVNLLKAMRSAAGNDIFYNSLPVAGSTGTLRNRFQGTPVAGKVHAKTGTLNGVRALSGYLEHPEYGEIAFSIVVNQPGQSGAILLQAIDQIVVQLARVSMCG
ncbi:D-alanyl-D-alanine carboxypeptidase [Egbenema bharatensis]|uniref:D-alanyl-D-alanine carboxypeptidase n=1 Tax=Egbenema bharatensis TaxID=3463334 RepID=UPI003A8B380D